MEDAHFCRNCGAPRQGSAGKVAEAPPLMEAEGGSARLLQGGGLYLQALVFFGSRWFRLHILVLLVTLVIKILWFQYPQGWVEGELALLLCYWAVQRMQNSAGCFGNRAESSSSIGCFLALSAVLVLIVGYFSALQVYVLQIEFALGLLSLALLIGQLLLASIAGLVFSSRARDTVLVLLGGSAAVAAVVVALVFDFGEKWSKEQLQSALSVGLFLGVGSMALAATAGAMVVVSDI
ncbi:unnamed protein product [Polarella glacialis]|uniref:Uncharacterized protein n=1 Tax=Polarella glacialis TaxID=89957 RepID=A0A813LTK8_POLGL|nr:unnamed protein product [Polarella glacialis]